MYLARSLFVCSPFIQKIVDNFRHLFGCVEKKIVALASNNHQLRIGNGVYHRTAMFNQNRIELPLHNQRG